MDKHDVIEKVEKCSWNRFQTLDHAVQDSIGRQQGQKQVALRLCFCA